MSKKLIVVLLSIILRCNSACADDTNILLIVVDTLPAHFVSAYDSHSRHTPHLDRLAAGGARFTHAYSVSSWTKPSIASILTSKMPSTHGVTAMADRLSEDELSAPEYFARAGYRTAGFVSHTILKKRSGFAQGFQTYEQMNHHKNPHMAVTSSDVSSAAIQWLSEHNSKKEAPFFLLLHYFDPHFRYKDHSAYKFADSYTGQLKPGMSLERLTKLRKTFSDQDISYLKNLFREEVAYTDQQIGRVLNYLKENNLATSTAVVMTADHGEEFMEHNSLGHTQTLHREITRIPLILSFPRLIKAGVYHTPVNQLDVLPTLTDLAKTPPEKFWQGRSLLPLLSSKGVLSQTPLFAEVAYRKVSTGGPIFPHLSSVWEGDLKLIIDRGRRKTMLFNIKSDPDEQNNLAEKHPDEVARLNKLIVDQEKKMRQLQKSSEKNEAVEFSADEVEKLKSLGYL